MPACRRLAGRLAVVNQYDKYCRMWTKSWIIDILLVTKFWMWVPRPWGWGWVDPM